MLSELASAPVLQPSASTDRLPLAADGIGKAWVPTNRQVNPLSMSLPRQPPLLSAVTTKRDVREEERKKGDEAVWEVEKRKVTTGEASPKSRESGSSDTKDGMS